ncbi:MAG: hypothetical protein ACRC7C_05980 [Beijerinckiaceae bacterium]
MSARPHTPLKNLVANPTAHFNAPVDVVANPDLTPKQKQKVLDAWEEDARRLSIATEEGMGGGEPSRIIEVAEAKTELGLPETRTSSPTKTG